MISIAAAKPPSKLIAVVPKDPAEATAAMAITSPRIISTGIVLAFWQAPEPEIRSHPTPWWSTSSSPRCRAAHVLRHCPPAAVQRGFLCPFARTVNGYQPPRAVRDREQHRNRLPNQSSKRQACPTDRMTLAYRQVYLSSPSGSAQSGRFELAWGPSFAAPS